MNEKEKKLENLMISKFNEAQLAKEEGRIIYAFNCLCKTYKIALKLYDGLYKKKSSFMLIETYPKVARFYIESATELLTNNNHHKCANYLKKAKKIVEIGYYFEKLHNIAKNEEILNEIEDLIAQNKEALKYLRIERFEKFKDGCCNVADSILDFMTDVFSSTTNGDETINTNEEDDTDHPEYKKAVSYYNSGIDMRQKSFTINSTSDLEYAIDYFEDCYKISKSKFPNLKHDALEMIAKCYYNLGQISEDNGERCMYSRSYNTARDYFSDAENYYLKGQENLPSDCYDYFCEAISRAKSSYYNADSEYRFSD